MSTFTTVNDYIQSFPTEVQSILELLRNTIREEIPEVEETISYNMPTYKLDGKYIVYFAAWKKHISLYPFTAEMIDAIDGASNYETPGQGTIQFPLDKPLPLELIRKIVHYLLAEKLKAT